MYSYLRDTTLVGESGDGLAVARYAHLNHEQPLREGHLESVWDRVVAGAVLGSERFVTQVRKGCAELSPEASRRRQFAGGVSWEELVRAVELVHGGRWDEFRDTYGDWGRDLALYLGQIHGRLPLAELAQRVGGIGYSAVAQAVGRARRLISQDAQWRRHQQAVEQQLSRFKM